MVIASGFKGQGALSHMTAGESTEEKKATSG